MVLRSHPGYYTRFGFRNAEGLVHEGVPPEVFFVLSFDGHVPQGTVEFHEAFQADGPQAGEIVRHHDLDRNANPWVHGRPPEEQIEVVAYDPAWPARFEQHARAIQDALGSAALEIEHIGSTAVPHLAAKPVIDIDLTVADPANEDAYVPRLAKLGYDLTIREPAWHEHRSLRLESPRVNLHVFGTGCPETIRHRLFRDWLRDHPEDRERYEQAKRNAIPGSLTVEEYNGRKQAVIREIYDRAFQGAGLLSRAEGTSPRD